MKNLEETLNRNNIKYQNNETIDYLIQIDKRTQENQNELKILNDKIDNLNKKIEQLLSESKKISKETERMDSHVTFVEGVYDKVKSPFHFVMDKITYMKLGNSGNSVSNSDYFLKLKR